MKKLVFSIITVILLFALVAMPCYAEETPDTVSENPGDLTENTGVDVSITNENAEILSDTLEDFAQGEEQGFLDQFTAIIKNGEIWAKIGASVLAVFALIIAVNKNLDKIGGALDTVKNMLAGKATKEETKNAIEGAISDVKNTYEKRHAELVEKYSAMETKYDHQTAVLTLLSLQLVKSPNARVQIMQLISNTKNVGEDIAGLVENIEAEIEAADAAEPKPDTPALDAVAAEIISDEIRENEETSYIALD